MKISAVLAILVLSVAASAQNPQDVVINEIMYAPTPSTNEWFEIYNKSGTTFNLINWKWKDAVGSQRIITAQNVNLAPNTFAVVCRDSNAVKAAYPNFSGIILQSVGWNDLNNTGGDQVILYNASTSIIDSVDYLISWGGSSGNRSLERKLATGPSNQQSNWGTSLDPTGATPGRTNSLTPKQNDLIVNNITFNPLTPSVGDSLHITTNIKNLGILPAPSYTVNFYEDYNRDSIPVPGELFYIYNSTQPLISGDSINIASAKRLDSTGLRLFIVKVSYAPDKDTLNNKRIAGIDVSNAGSGTVTINEIMYDNPTGECEWVELYNNSDTVVNLRNWTIKDSSGIPVTITNTDYNLARNDYVVISQSNAIFTAHPNLPPAKVIIPGSFPSLNNGGDAVVIRKPNNIAADSVAYRSTWGGVKVSLERISFTGPSNDQSNWTSSIDCEKSSPARANSITTAVHYSHYALVVNEIMASPFSKEAEWFELYNPGTSSVNISHWLMEETGGTHIFADTCSANIPPGAYAVISSDSTIFARYSYLTQPDSTRKVFVTNSSLGLNNDEDLIKITDLFRTTIDSVHYFDSWHNPNLPSATGISLEKINPVLPSNDRSSWSSCTLPVGGTPGMKNSIFTTVIPTSAEISVFPNPFSPDGDGFEDFTVISFKLTSGISQVRIKVFDVKGRLVRTIINNQPSASNGNIIFNGFDDSGQKLRIGIYIIFLEALNDQNGIVNNIKTTVVVAARL